MATDRSFFLTAREEEWAAIKSIPAGEARQDSHEALSSLQGKKVSPHVLRHTSAMELLQSGVDVTVIALWLGHELIETTHVYLEADLDMKRNMLAKTTAHDATPGRYKPADTLLAFLKAL